MTAVILCVDDEPIVLKVRGLVLTQAGYEPVLANTAKEALELFASLKVDLVITDHLLPGQSGVQLAAELKRIKPEVPIMLLSGLPEPPEGLDHVDAYLTKGGSVPEFLEQVTRLLESPC